MDRIDRVDSVWTWVTLSVVIVVAVLALHWPPLVFAPIAAWAVWEASIKMRRERQNRRRSSVISPRDDESRPRISGERGQGIASRS
jgi:hypothetical protein